MQESPPLTQAERYELVWRCIPDEQTVEGHKITPALQKFVLIALNEWASSGNLVTLDGRSGLPIDELYDALATKTCMLTRVFRGVVDALQLCDFIHVFDKPIAAHDGDGAHVFCFNWDQIGASARHW